GIIFCVTLLGCLTETEDRYIFFLHNRCLETHDLNESHPEYGKTAYLEIIEEFKDNGFTVISEQRNGNVNAHEYATLVTALIDSLIQKGVSPKDITVVG